MFGTPTPQKSARAFTASEMSVNSAMFTPGAKVFDSNQNETAPFDLKDSKEPASLFRKVVENHPLTDDFFDDSSENENDFENSRSEMSDSASENGDRQNKVASFSFNKNHALQVFNILTSGEALSTNGNGL